MWPPHIFKHTFTEPCKDINTYTCNTHIVIGSVHTQLSKESEKMCQESPPIFSSHPKILLDLKVFFRAQFIGWFS